MPANEVIIKPQNNTSLFQEFIKNSTKSPSRKAQQNFLNIITSVADIIKKICVSEKLIFDVSYDGKKYWQQAKKVYNNLRMKCTINLEEPFLGDLI